MANPVFCPKCGTANLPQAQYCDQCSAPLHKLIAPGARPGFDPATQSLPPPPVSAPQAGVPGVSAPASLPLDPPVEPTLPHLPARGQGAADPNRRRRNSSSLPLIVGAVLAVGLFLGIGLMAILTGMGSPSASATATPPPDTAATAQAINNQATAVAAQMLALQATQAALAGTQASPTVPASSTPEPPAATPTLAAAVPTAVPTTPPTAPSTATSDPRAVLQAFPPQIEFPAQIQRAANAEQGTLSFQCPELTGINAVVSSLTAEPVGQITDDGHEFVFHFAKLPYAVAALPLPNGTTLAAQTLSLDPAQPSTLHVDLQTGIVTRDFHWLLTASNAKYNGKAVLALADHGQTQLVEVKNTTTNVYQVRLATTWQAPVMLDSWTVDGREVAGGQCTLTMHLDNTYLLDYNK